MQPSTEKQAERDEMVQSQLAGRGIRDPRLLEAMRRIPRHRFVPPALADRAYEDCALPVAAGQTISQPYMVARMTELLALRPDARVLEIGAGTGYQTAVLAELASRVFSVEWHLSLLTAAAERVRGADYHNVEFRCGDGSLGWPEHAPYDGILVAAGAPHVPDSLCEQLALHGTLVVPVGDKEEQSLVIIRRLVDGFERDTHTPCRFVRLMGREGWRDSD
jgi:protein-L-isoaspartate(D-aspartate) O-methyltransferase